MTRVHFTVETAVPAEQVLAAATDFSERRPDVWPNISRRFYTVHEIGETWAEVTEGSDTMGGIWARERYEWSTPGVVRATVQDSNVFRMGGTWEVRVHAAAGGGSQIELTRARRGAGLKGTVIEAMLAVVGRKVLSDGLQQTLQRLTNGAVAERELGQARRGCREESAMNERERIPVIFLPGIIMPAALRYAPLLRELGESVHAVTKDLEVYATDSPPDNYSIEEEVAGISRAADAAGFERFHLYGHSGGGASALAYVASHPERVLSLALDEPATDFDPTQQAQMRTALAQVADLPPQEGTRYFLQRQLAPGVPLPPTPEGPPPPWMAQRPAGIQAFMKAISEYHLDTDRLRAFDRPVYYSYGRLSSPEWQAMRDRLSAVFPDFTAELYKGASHLNTSHQREPARVATALRQVWQRAEATTSEQTASP